jgi:Tfp pilus assembly protein PilO
VRKSPNPKIFLFLAVGTFVVGAGAVYTAYSGLSEQEAKVADLKSQVKPTKDVQKALDDSEKDLTDTTAKLKHLEQGVPDFAYIPTMLGDLQAAGKASGLDVTGVKPMPAPPVNPKQGEKQERKPYDEQLIEIKGRGTYASVLKFIQGLQTFPKIVAARTVTMTPKTDPLKGVTGLDVTIELKAFVFPQPAGAPGAPGTATTPGTPGAPAVAGAPGSTPTPTPGATPTATTTPGAPAPKSSPVPTPTGTTPAAKPPTMPSTTSAATAPHALRTGKP